MVTHYIDLLNWFFEAEPESVYARAVMLEKNIPPDRKPSDYVSGTLVYRNGIICGLESSYQRYGVSYDNIEVYGDEHTVILRDGRLRLFRKKEEGIRSAVIALGMMESSESGKVYRF